MTKQIKDLKVGDVIVGIETTMFDEPHTIVTVNVAMAITNKGGAYPLQQMGHFVAHTSN
jgi:hypothetical protein